MPWRWPVAIAASIAARGVPLKVLDLKRQTAICDGAALVLSRPDQHVAWRGVALPTNPR
jgi:hypothetical protein